MTTTTRESFNALFSTVAGTLYDYTTGDMLRTATADELAASIEVAEFDGGAGVIDVDGRSCYVVE